MAGRLITHIFIDGIESKKCSRCGNMRPIGEYYRSKVTSDSRRSACKKCDHNDNAAAYSKDPDYTKNRFRKWAHENPQRMKEIEKERWLSDHRKKYSRDRQKKVRLTEKGTIDNRMKWALWDALSGSKKGRKWNELVGYEASDLIYRLSETMPSGYSWERIKELHIDHIRPKSSFQYDSVNDPAFRECWGLANLQFLPASENFKKGNKIMNEGGKIWHHQ